MYVYILLICILYTLYVLASWPETVNDDYTAALWSCRSGSQQGGAGLGQLVQSSVLAGKGKQSPAKRAMARANLFGEDGVSAILHAMDQLPLMRRLGVLQVGGALALRTRQPPCRACRLAAG